VIELMAYGYRDSEFFFMKTKTAFPAPHDELNFCAIASFDNVQRSFYLCGMDIKTQILSSAEYVFDHGGFAATGMDQLVQAAQVSSRTLYKYVGSKTALIVAVLNERARRFFSLCQVSSVEEIFEVLEKWTLIEGARGCLFLRAQAETGGDAPDIAAAVAAYRNQLRELIENIVTGQAGCSRDDERVEQILVLFEGAISTSTYCGAHAIATARTVAMLLMSPTKPPA